MPCFGGSLGCQGNVHEHPAVTWHGKGKRGLLVLWGFSDTIGKRSLSGGRVLLSGECRSGQWLATDRSGDVDVSRVPPSYETRMTHRGAMALVGQKSLHLKQPMQSWACTGSALWCTILNTPIEQRSTQTLQPLQKIWSTYTSIKIDGEGPISMATSLIRFHSLVIYKYDCKGQSKRASRNTVVFRSYS